MDVSERLKSLPGLSKPGLCTLWRELFKEAAPSDIRRELLVRILAYRIQEQAYGGLSKGTRTRLRELASAFNSNSGVPNSIAIRIKPGTRLIREWQGKTHEVTVAEGSYEYRGARYSSLSEIARLITGTRWSGPLFFGLKANRSKEKPNHS